MKGKIYEKIRQLREDNHITQKQLAEYLGITQALVSQLESSERNFSMGIISKLTDLFVCDFEDLIDENKDVKAVLLPYRKTSYSVEDLSNVSDARKIIKNFNEMIDMKE